MCPFSSHSITRHGHRETAVPMPWEIPRSRNAARRCRVVTMARARASSDRSSTTASHATQNGVGMRSSRSHREISWRLTVSVPDAAHSAAAMVAWELPRARRARVRRGPRPAVATGVTPGGKAAAGEASNPGRVVGAVVKGDMCMAAFSGWDWIVAIGDREMSLPEITLSAGPGPGRIG